MRINGRARSASVYRQAGAAAWPWRMAPRPVAEIEKELPEGSKLDFVIDQTESVRKAIDSLIPRGHGILVAAMILVFLGQWRMTIAVIIAAGGPVRDHRSVGDREHDQRHDPGRPVPGLRPARR